MGAIVNPKWKARISDKIKQQKPTEPLELDETISYRPALQRLIIQLSSKGILYELYDLGAGVKRITTATDICPCCKRKK